MTACSGTHDLRGLARAALITIIALTAACSGIIVEPASNGAVTGPTRFWGYATVPGQEMRLEAQNTSGTWELLASTLATTRPTYGSGHLGYYWEVMHNPKLEANRFRRPVTSGYQVFYRVKNPNFSPCETHTLASSIPAEDFEQLWALYKTDGVIRLNVF